MKNTEMRQELIQLGGGAHALAIQILGNPDDAADAVHEAFAKVLARPAAYDVNKGAFKPWFLRVVRNQCVDLLRRRRTVESVNALVNPGKAPDQALEALQRDESLKRALSGMPAEQRQILVLRDYLDLSYAEIADVLSLAAGTVMSRLHRARLALRGVLERNDG
ncbi:MAG: sigma-70 family RNA polymerase sigma factor [Xanthomonadales bacterium]|nr:sigma-70 family RNA polymerase sigma factor [Gammaproteobacteria bacterium]MBT8053583.1 sigma-70 family RNA polymerase sigma factor [Gammaproteobacteria bacterium]NNK50898.1 sigma-70 family RNA polymerase sigma factor [Xanthomonadales bacterium]